MSGWNLGWLGGLSNIFSKKRPKINASQGDYEANEIEFLRRLIDPEKERRHDKFLNSAGLLGIILIFGSVAVDHFDFSEKGIILESLGHFSELLKQIGAPHFLKEMGFALIISYTIGRTIDFNAKNDLITLAKNSSREIAGNIYRYLYNVNLSRDVFEVIEETLFKAKFYRKSTRIHYEFREITDADFSKEERESFSDSDWLELSRDWLFVENMLSYTVVNIGNNGGNGRDIAPDVRKSHNQDAQNDVGGNLKTSQKGRGLGFRCDDSASSTGDYFIPLYVEIEFGRFHSLEVISKKLGIVTIFDGSKSYSKNNPDDIDELNRVEIDGEDTNTAQISRKKITIPFGHSKQISITHRMLKRKSDKELYRSLYVADGFHVTVSMPKGYVVKIDPVVPAKSGQPWNQDKAKHNDHKHSKTYTAPVSGRVFEECVIPHAILPGNGVLIWWEQGDPS